MAFGVTDLKKGQIFQLDDVPYRVIDYAQKVMGRGGSIVNVKIRSLVDGRVLDKTFKGNESIEPAEVTSRNVQYLYKDSAAYFFMDEDNYEQFEVPIDNLEDLAGFIKESDRVQAQLFNGQVINIVLPKNVSLKVIYTENAVKGDTSSAISKDATLETGIVIKVPAFVKTGDNISVDTTTGVYRERIK
ncbi:elongation factor P [Candidatus Saccharibacteria bacterium]|nr:elongation factor P [Candidatus Saccharibacteria bacterium]